MTRDEWRLARHGLLAALSVLLVLLQILASSRNFALFVHVGILDAIVLAVFLLSKHMKHRRKSN